MGSFNKWLLIGLKKLGDVGQPSNLVSLERQLCAHSFGCTGTVAGACQPSSWVVTPMDVHTIGKPGVGY